MKNTFLEIIFHLLACLIANIFWAKNFLKEVTWPLFSIFLRKKSSASTPGFYFAGKILRAHSLSSGSLSVSLPQAVAAHRRSPQQAKCSHLHRKGRTKVFVPPPSLSLFLPLFYRFISYLDTYIFDLKQVYEHIYIKLNLDEYYGCCFFVLRPICFVSLFCRNFLGFFLLIWFDFSINSVYLLMNFMGKHFYLCWVLFNAHQLFDILPQRIESNFFTASCLPFCCLRERERSR